MPFLAKFEAKWIASIAACLVIIPCLLYGGYTLLNVTANRIISSQAERVALAWAAYAGSELNRLEEIASGARPNETEIAFLERLRLFGDVFRFKLFDANGRIRLISDDLGSAAEKEGSLGDHNLKAASVVKTGVPFTSIEDGTAKADRPDVYVETYVPVRRNGKNVAIVEVYVDQTGAAISTRKEFGEFGVQIMGLTALALVLPIGFLVIMVRRQRLQNAELETERDNARVAQRAKSEFLANMSHEIRTPLNGVLGMAGLLSATKLTDTQTEYANLIVSSGESLLTLLNDILDFSKIEAGKIDLEDSVFDTVQLLDTAVYLLAAQAHGKGLEVPTFVAPDVPGTFVGDQGRIRQVLLNLIGNAIKFTAEGGVSIDLSVAEKNEHDGSFLLRFEIGDTGIGIPEDAREELFNEFYQVDGSHTRHFEGTGLGLAISKNLVELMGGEIGMEPQQTGGSIFWFTVRVKQHQHTDSWVTESGLTLRDRKILVVDDNAVNRLVFERQLKALGVNVETAINADSALKKLLAATNDEHPFEAAIIDHFMPGTDGIDLADMIHGMAGYEDMKLVFSSSSGEYNSDNSVKKHGFDASLPKPLRPGSLLRCAAILFADRTVVDKPGSEELSDRQRKGDASTRILVAEDNHVNQKVIRAILKGQGFSVDVVANGIEAIEAVTKFPFDLILMDIKMPEMDGVEATRRIRQLSNNRNGLPIIGVTANAMSGDREKVIQAGMNDYLSKPINEKELFDKISFWLNLGKSKKKVDDSNLDFGSQDENRASDSV